MKRIKHSVLILLLLSTVSCATLTRQDFDVQRDECLTKFAEVNSQILGDLKYDNPDLDLKTLGIKDYPELVVRIELTDDYTKAVGYILDQPSERKFIVERDTFYICIRSENHKFIICDDPETPGADKVKVETPLPPLQEYYSTFLGWLNTKRITNPHP